MRCSLIIGNSMEQVAVLALQWQTGTHSVFHLMRFDDDGDIESISVAFSLLVEGLCNGCLPNQKPAALLVDV